jgi:hypothetical protein
MRFRRRSRLESLLEDYCDGALDDAARGALERRLAADARARALLQEMRDARAALHALRERPAPLFDDAVFARIRGGIVAERFAKKPVLPLESGSARFYRRLAMAATLLFAVTASFLATRKEGPGTSPAGIGPLTPAPTAEERGREPIEELIRRAARPGGLSGAEYAELLRELGMDPRDAVLGRLLVPISEPSPSWR